MFDRVLNTAQVSCIDPKTFLHVRTPNKVRTYLPQNLFHEVSKFQQNHLTLL